ncbi:hypothetical protein [Ornithinibacillus scapharcae]|uniref:hypothetical protein n=1 Tax=Ornithinibacillus scapharcae TaxID=1147159 RepID=UPI000225B027|nr:hypothetical protein [Ornithinibacillus scapharcae]
MQTALILEESSPYVPNIFVNAWEMLIQEMFHEFTLFFAPEIYDEIDFSNPPQFLHQEHLQEVIQGEPRQNVYTHIIIAKLRNGKEKWILVHFNFNNHNESLRRRMFHYFYRIYDHFNQKVYPIVLVYQKEHNRIDYYDYHYYGTSIIYKYNVFSVLEQDVWKLEKSSNPFAVINLAIIYSNFAKDQLLIRFFFKKNLMIHVLNRFASLNQTSKTALLQYIDIVFQLPDHLQHRLKEEIKIITRQINSL